MGELSLAGLIGAFVGLVAGWVSAVVVIRVVESRLRKLDKSESPTERSTFEDKLVLMRRLILGIEVAVFTIVGYAVGHLIDG
jgi:hypothetical protein